MRVSVGGVAKVLAEKRDKKQVEMNRRSKLKQQLAKAYIAEGIPISEFPTPKTTLKAMPKKFKDPSAGKQRNKQSTSKPNPFKREIDAFKHAKVVKEDLIQKSNEELKAKQEIAHHNRQIRFLKNNSLSKKTKKGQPVLSNSIDHLLDKIRKQVQ